MKKTTSFLLFSFFLSAWAQDSDLVSALMDGPDISVESSSVRVNKTQQPGWSLFVYGDAGKVEKDWLGVLEKDCQCKLKKSKGYYEGLGIHLPSVSSETLSLTTRVVEMELGGEIEVAVDLGGRFVTSSQTPGEATKLKTVMETCTVDFYTDWYGKVIGDEKKVLSKLEKEHNSGLKEGEKLEKNISGLESDTQKAKDGILKAEKEILDLEARLDELKAEIEQHQKEIVQLEKVLSGSKKSTEEKLSAVNNQKARVEALKKSASTIKN